MFKFETCNLNRYIADLLRDRLLFAINRLYLAWVLLGLAIPAVLGGLLTGTWMGSLTGFLWGGLARIFLVHHAAWSLVSISHLFGSSPYSTRDHSTNNIWTSLPTFGESWHNNHHAFPYSAYHGLSWWQIDLNGLCIRVLSVLGLAWDVKIPTPRMISDALNRSRSAGTTPS
jgi:stearoyl-CoA desaturase (delta-9 desaturase)